MQRPRQYLVKIESVVIIAAVLLVSSTSWPILRSCRSASCGSTINPPGEHVTKDELRAELERQAQRYKDVYGGEVVTYAAQPDPERRPWRKKASLLDQAFQQEIEKIEKARESD